MGQVHPLAQGRQPRADQSWQRTGDPRVVLPVLDFGILPAALRKEDQPILHAQTQLAAHRPTIAPQSRRFGKRVEGALGALRPHHGHRDQTPLDVQDFGRDQRNVGSEVPAQAGLGQVPEVQPQDWNR
jgi:hypothetical protein